MKHFSSKTILIMICVLMAVGCGTIIHGSMQNVTINSVPSTASIWIDGVEMAKTPSIVSLKRKDDHTIRLVKEGHEDATLKIVSSLDWTFFGNIIFGGLIGCAVDLGTGSCYSLSPEQLTVNLQEAQKLHGQELYIPSDDLQKIKSVKFVNGAGMTELLVSVQWIE